MVKRALLTVVAIAALSSRPLFADDSNLDVATSGVAENSVSISIHNPDSDAETARITLSVELINGTEQTLTSSNVTVEGGATVSITLSAAHTIVAIGDDPEPISPAY